MRVIVVVVVVVVAVVVGVLPVVAGAPVVMIGVGMVVRSGGMEVVTLPAMFTGGIVRSVSPVLVRQLLPRVGYGSIARSAMGTVDEARRNDNRSQFRAVVVRRVDVGP